VSRNRHPLRGADRQLGPANPELRASFGQLAHGVGRGLPAGRAGLNIDRKPGLGIKALPQCGVIAGELKLRRPAQLQHDRLGSGHRMSHTHHRQRSGASHHSRHRASPYRAAAPLLYVSAKPRRNQSP